MIFLTISPPHSLLSLPDPTITFLFPSNSFLSATGSRLSYCCSCFFSHCGHDWMFVRVAGNVFVSMYALSQISCLFMTAKNRDIRHREPNFAGNRQSSFKLSALSTCHTGRCVYNTQQTNTHAPVGIRTRDPSSREASDREEYRFHGIWHNIQTSTQVFTSTKVFLGFPVSTSEC